MGKRSVDEGTQAKGKYGMAGDDMGGVSKLDFSAKIHFYSLPILEHLQIFPFVFGGIYYPNFCPMRLKSPAMAAGVGLGWSSKFGRFEATFTPWHQSSNEHDVKAGFQFRFSD